MLRNKNVLFLKKNVKCHAEKDFVIENNCKNSSL